MRQALQSVTVVVAVKFLGGLILKRIVVAGGTRVEKLDASPIDGRIDVSCKEEELPNHFLHRLAGRDCWLSNRRYGGAHGGVVLRLALPRLRELRGGVAEQRSQS